MKKKVTLEFPPEVIGKPVVSDVIKGYDVIVNIFKTMIKPNTTGMMGVEIEGDEKEIGRALKFLKKNGVRIKPLEKEITKSEMLCTHCGVCVSVCPTQALSLDRKTFRVNFDKKKCILCGLCVDACPYKAINIEFW